MGDVLSFNPLGWPDGLAPSPAEEVERVGAIHGVIVSVARQAASPGYVHVTVTDQTSMNATGVAVAPDSDDGLKLARFVARAILRSLDAVSWVPKPTADPSEPEA